MYSITSESARHPDILSLIAALDRYQSELYPAESNHLIDLAATREKLFNYVENGLLSANSGNGLPQVENLEHSDKK